MGRRWRYAASGVGLVEYSSHELFVLFAFVLLILHDVFGKRGNDVAMKTKSWYSRTRYGEY